MKTPYEAHYQLIITRMRIIIKKR